MERKESLYHNCFKWINTLAKGNSSPSKQKPFSPFLSVTSCWILESYSSKWMLKILEILKSVTQDLTRFFDMYSHRPWSHLYRRCGRQQGTGTISSPVLNSFHRPNWTLELPTNTGNWAWEKSADLGNFNNCWATMFQYIFKSGLRNLKWAGLFSDLPQHTDKQMDET